MYIYTAHHMLVKGFLVSARALHLWPVLGVWCSSWQRSSSSFWVSRLTLPDPSQHWGRNWFFISKAASDHRYRCDEDSFAMSEELDVKLDCTSQGSASGSWNLSGLRIRLATTTIWVGWEWRPIHIYRGESMKVMERWYPRVWLWYCNTDDNLWLIERYPQIAQV